ncbi:MAG: CD3324 family protein [Bacillota bacterium]|nr:CD3324 family protein [Bacillota bacterium]
MGYKNGKEVLPAELLKELQKYIQGELIYIPTLVEGRKGWGESNGTREYIRERNFEIYSLYKEGFTTYELMCKYNLSEDSIRKIVCKLNKELSSGSFIRNVSRV